MHTALRISAAIAGVAIVLVALRLAVRTLVLPRAVPAFISRMAAVAVRYLFLWRAKTARTFIDKGRAPEAHGPTIVLVDPDPGDPISITRAEFDAACAEMESASLPLKSDRDQAWRDFAGWRVNYDTVLVVLAGLLVAPWTPWSSDRAALLAPPASDAVLRRNAVAPVPKFSGWKRVEEGVGHIDIGKAQLTAPTSDKRNEPGQVARARQCELKVAKHTSAKLRQLLRRRTTIDSVRH